MSLRNLFGKKSNKILSSTTIDEVGQETESTDYIKSVLEDKKRFVPEVDYTDPANFARFGSAKKYYLDAINDIYTRYPYDGSLYEKLDFHNNATDLENYIFENEYPRQNGYVNIGVSYGTGSTTTNGYLDPDSKEYIFFKGGPHAADDASSKNLNTIFEEANKYNTDLNRESNLEINGDVGLTLEFYLKKDDLSGSEKQVIFDIWNSASFGAADYGRFKVEIHPGVAGEEEQFYIELMSGTSGIYETSIGTGLNLSGSEWHHYSISAINSGSQLYFRLTEDGNLNEKFVTGSSVSLVEGAMLGTIGALVTEESGTHGALGWGKLSASLDEVRYWKEKRVDKEIARYFFTDIGGGTNTDEANTSLGVYYKFNEGIMSTSSIHTLDTKVLDYSGRITNGTWTGYQLGSRNTGSAIVIGGFEEEEFQDPVVYSNHPDVVALEEEKTKLGEEHDSINNASMYYAFPDWIIEEDQDRGREGLLELTQIMSSFFDDLFMKIEALPRIKDATYRTGKPLPFASKLLESMGFVSSDLFVDATMLESILSRDEDENFDEKLHNVKNHIYQNIYNNLVYIYRSKGSEKSIRNLIRCFGIDNEIIKLNLYADGVDYGLQDRYNYTAERKKYVDFNDTDRFDSVVYQMSQSSNVNSVSFISGSEDLKYLGTTMEAEVIFPKKFKRGDSFFFRTDFVSGSLFGMHEADPSSPADTTWFGSDRAELSVFALRPEEESKDVRFKLTSSYFGVDLTTDLYRDVYDNEKWNFAVRLKHEKHPISNGVLGSDFGNYLLEFYGVNTLLDSVQNEFLLTASVSSALAEGHFAAAKRIYAGAHRQDFTGSLIVGPGTNGDQFSDAKISSVRYWTSIIPDEAIVEHAKDVKNHGALSPYSNVDTFLATALSGTYVPQMETLALDWDFESVTGSDNGSGLPPSNQSDAGFEVLDVSSGSVSFTDRYGFLNDIVKVQHSGKGDFFLRNNDDVVQREYVNSAKRRLPESLTDSDMVQILRQDDEQFTRDSQPVNHYFALEKSMYQTISEEMLNFFGSVKDFNNLIGNAADRYRQEYKELGKLRSLFFERVDNTPDFEKYVEYYKWVDNAILQMVMQLIPASANFSEEMSNLVESHILERNKYWNKFPTLELTLGDPEGGTHSINIHKYNWKFGHHPVDNDQGVNCLWWRERAERNSSTGHDLNEERQELLDVTLFALNRNFTTIYDLDVEAVVILSEKKRDEHITKTEVGFDLTNSRYIEITSDQLILDGCLVEDDS